VTRDSRVDRRFWTLLQASFYETYQRRGHRIFPHRVLDWVSLRTAAGGADVREHFAHFRGLPRLLQIEQNRYIEDWVRVFYARAWIAPERRAVHFVFGGHVFGLSRATLAGILGVDLVDVSLHEMVYGDADPPHRAMIGGIAPSHEAISQCFRQPFPASYARVPSLLTQRHTHYIWHSGGLCYRGVATQRGLQDCSSSCFYTSSLTSRLT
jgi:hypothetical protein